MAIKPFSIYVLFIVVIPSRFMLVIDRLIESLQQGDSDSITTILVWADMLYKICTYNVFRDNLPIVGIGFYIDLM